MSGQYVLGCVLRIFVDIGKTNYDEYIVTVKINIYIINNRQNINFVSVTTLYQKMESKF